MDENPYKSAETSGERRHFDAAALLHSLARIVLATMGIPFALLAAWIGMLSFIEGLAAVLPSFVVCFVIASVGFIGVARISR